MSGRLWVPVVQLKARPRVVLCETVSQEPPPAWTYRTVVEPSEELCASVEGHLSAERGERLLEAQVCAPSRDHAGWPLEGRSCALGMALAALQRHFRGALEQDTVVTGDLNPGTGSVCPVDHLGLKLCKAAERLCAGGGQILYPACQADREDKEVLRLAEDFPSVVFRPVKTLQEAAGWIGIRLEVRQVSRLRSEIEHLRDSNDRIDELFARAKELAVLAGSMTEEARLGAVLRFHAVTVGQFAASRLGDGARGWPSVSWEGARLGQWLGEEAQRLYRVHGDHLPGDLRAEYLNFLALEDWCQGAFEDGAARATEGLRDAGAGGSGEARKVRNTRGQLLWRVALRHLGLGDLRLARRYAREAAEDVRTSLEEAMAFKVPAKDDGARARIYRSQALLVCELVGVPLSVEDRDEILEQLEAVLGRFGTGQSDQKPLQDPGWGVQALYLVFRAQGAWEAILDHWRRCSGALDGSLGRRACDAPLLELVLEAAVRTGHREEAEWVAALWGRVTSGRRPSLARLVGAWPGTWAGDWDLPALDWVSRWARGEWDELEWPLAARENLWVEARLEELREGFAAGDLFATDAARRQLLLWLGDVVPREAQVQVSEREGATRFVLERGVTRKLQELPPGSVALDGYVQGPSVDAGARRYSFDHHGGCVRHATLSTCEMVVDAVRVGLDPRGLTVFVNDLDRDTVLASWVLRRPGAVLAPRVVQAIGKVGRLDALGPSVGLGADPSICWAMEPIEPGPGEVPLRERPVEEWRRLLDEVHGRLDAWWRAGAPARAPGMVPRAARPSSGSAGASSSPSPVSPVVLFESPAWTLAESAEGVGAFASLYRRGVRAGVVTRRVRGTREYTVGKRSEFVEGFDVPAILQALREAERAMNPGQPDEHTWGGGSTIGGSPRNPDGTASRLDPETVREVVERARGG